MKHPKLVLLLTDPLTVNAFFVHHIQVLSNHYEVHLLVGHGYNSIKNLPATIHITGLSRKPNPIADLKTLVLLVRLIKKLEPTILLSVTPKAGLVGQLAAAICRIPFRIHYFTGQVWVTQTGIARHILKKFDVLIGKLSSHLLTDSPSQLSFLIKQKVTEKQKIQVLGHGSISGVDLDKFKPNPEERKKIRSQLGLSENSLIFLFLGRLNRDKGIDELLTAFKALPTNAYLLLVGPCENTKLLENLPNNCFYVSQSNQPEKYYAAADIFVLFSKREGFGTSALEASATGLPVIASKIYGLTDAVAENETGLLVELGDYGGLRNAMLKLMEDSQLRTRLGIAGRERASKQFSNQVASAHLLTFLQELGNQEIK